MMESRFGGLIVATVMCATLGAAGGTTGVLVGGSLCAPAGASEQSGAPTSGYAGR
jgi:hypothetical protein